VRIGIADVSISTQEDTQMVMAAASVGTVVVTADGEGLVSHAGTALLVELADRAGLTSAMSAAMASTRERRSAHDPGRVLRDVAVWRRLRDRHGRIRGPGAVVRRQGVGDDDASGAQVD
jgi:hypothetical protein